MSTDTATLELLKAVLCGLAVRLTVQEVPYGGVTNSQGLSDTCIGLSCVVHTDCFSLGSKIELPSRAVPFLKAARTENRSNFRLAVLEGFPSENEFDCHTANVEANGDLFTGFSCCIPTVDGGDVSFSDFCPRDLIPSSLGSVPQPIFTVLLGGAPAKVFEVVVNAVTIEVSALHTGRTGTDESHENKSMNAVGSSSAVFGQLHSWVSVFVLPWGQFFALDGSESIPFPDQSCSRSHSTLRGNLICPIETGNVSPSFSHVLPLKSYGYKPPYCDFKEQRFTVKGVCCA